MIGEPEMAHAEDGRGAAPDTLSDSDAPPLLGRHSGRPWAWAAGAVVLTSAVWAGALQATGYGRTQAPDLHGYRITNALCAEADFKGLLDALDAHTFNETGAVAITRSSALDHADCQLWAIGPPGSKEQFVIAVDVDLHKKTDPAAEFDAVKHVTVPTPGYGDALVVSGVDEGPATHPSGLGDRANLTSNKYQQKLAVRHGGAVLTLTLTATTQVAKLDKDGNPQFPRPTDTRSHAKDLVPAMCDLMAALARPAGGH